MRALLISLLLILAHTTAVAACSCFPPEVQAKTAQEALQKAQVAVYGRVLTVDALGKAQVLVLESVQGATHRRHLRGRPGRGHLRDPPTFTVGEEALLLSFTAPLTACDKLPPDHYLLDAFRSQPATPGLAIQR